MKKMTNNLKALTGGVGCLGMGSVGLGHRALGFSEMPQTEDQKAPEKVLRWVDNHRKVAVPNATIEKYFPGTYEKRIAPKIVGFPRTPQHMSNKEAVKRAHREIQVLR